MRRFGWIEVSENPLTSVDTGGESWAWFVLRVSETLVRIAREQCGKTVAILCPGGVINASFIHFFGMNPHALPPTQMHTANTSLTHWTYTLRKERWLWRLDTYNDIRHLAGWDADAFTPPVASAASE